MSKNKKKSKLMNRINYKEQEVSKQFINNNNKSNLKMIIICYLISRLFLIIFLIIKGDLSILELYDGQHYIEMAKNGYSSSFLYAFFPMYPLLIRMLNIIILIDLLIFPICSSYYQTSQLLLNKIVGAKLLTH